MTTKSDWHVWRAYLRASGRTIAVAVAKKGDSARSAFRNLPQGRQVDFQRRATIQDCTKQEAEAVMKVLSPDVIGMPS